MNGGRFEDEGRRFEDEGDASVKNIQVHSARATIEGKFTISAIVRKWS